MTRYIAFLVAFVVLAGLVPDYFERYEHRSPVSPERPPAASVETASADAPALPQASYLGNGRVAMLEPNAQGHFTASFRINGTPVDGMVDTGATYVAMNASTAGNLGIHPAPGDFAYSVQTANGVTRAARVRLASVEVGQVRVDNVDAFVLSDTSFTETLIGMSFLKRLNSYQVSNGVLALKN